MRRGIVRTERFCAALVLLFWFTTVICNAAEHRIISLAPSTTEILFKLGLGDSIVGVDRYSNYPEGVRLIEKVGQFDRPNIERIILLKPDYILVNVDISKDASRYLESLGTKIIKVSPGTVNELCNDIIMLGGIFHRRKKAWLIVNDIRMRIKNISRNMPEYRPKVFVQLFSDPLITVSSFIGDVIRLAGGENIAQDVKNDRAFFSYESLIERNPDLVIMVGFSGDDNLPRSINAVKKHRIYKNLNPDIFLRPGPRAIEAVEDLNRIFNEKN